MNIENEFKTFKKHVRFETRKRIYFKHLKGLQKEGILKNIKLEDLSIKELESYFFRYIFALDCIAREI